MQQFLDYLKGLGDATAPDYNYICKLYDEMFASSGADLSIPYDWDTNKDSANVDVFVFNKNLSKDDTIISEPRYLEIKTRQQRSVKIENLVNKN